MKKRIFILIILFCLIVGVCFSAYTHVKKTTEQQSSAYQKIIAKQVGQQIEALVHKQLNELSLLASIPHIVHFGEEGKLLIKRFYERSSQDEVKAITRVDANGTILYTYPENKQAIGADISYQDHIQEISKIHIPVISELFRTVQGYTAIALHVPIIEQGEYLGTIAYLLPFSSIAEKCFANFDFGNDGFALILSSKGVNLLSHNSLNAKELAYESFGQYRGGKGILDKMLARGEGYAEFQKKSFHRYHEEFVSYRAYYHPIEVMNKSWSILIAFSKPDILKDAWILQKRLLALVLLSLVLTATCIMILSRAWKILSTYQKQKKIEKDTEKYRGLLKSIIDSIPSMLVGVDKNGTVLQWNKKAEESTGIAAHDAIGVNFTQVLPQFAGEMEKIKRAIARQKTQIQERVTRNEGSNVIVEDIEVFPLMSGSLEAAVIKIDDVTEKVKVEELLVQAEKMTSVGGLAAGMAHEINNPLAGIMQNIQVLRNRLKKDNPKNNEAAEKCGTTMEAIESYMRKRGLFSMINSILESGERASNIVTNMLGFSRKSTAQFQPYSLSQLLNKTVRLIGNDYDLKKIIDFQTIEIVRKFEDNLPDIECEGQTIQQVCLNLLKNSAYALSKKVDSAESPQIILRLFRKGQVLRLEVEDNGPGIGGEDIKRVFEPFFTTKNVGSGTGLGLSVSYFIITERHGGTMGVCSEPGKFTKFTISLPIKRKHE